MEMQTLFKVCKIVLTEINRLVSNQVSKFIDGAKEVKSAAYWNEPLTPKILDFAEGTSLTFDVEFFMSVILKLWKNKLHKMKC